MTVWRMQIAPQLGRTRLMQFPPADGVPSKSRIESSEARGQCRVAVAAAPARQPGHDAGLGPPVAQK